MKERYSRYRTLEAQMGVMGGFFKEFFRQSMNKTGRDAASDLSMLELKGLAAFTDVDGSYSISSLSAQAQVPLSNMTFIIKRLEGKGIARKQRSRTDRRYVDVQLTPYGKKLFRQFISRRCEEFEKTLGRLSAQDRRELFRAIEKATGILQKLKA